MHFIGAKDLSSLWQRAEKIELPRSFAPERTGPQE